MMWLRSAGALLLFGEAVIACGGATTPSTSSGSYENATSGSADFYAQSYVPTPGSTIGASYQRNVTFTAAGQAGCGLKTTMIVGPCSVNPCLAPPPPDGGTETLASAGIVAINGAELPVLSLEPASDGAYAANIVDGQIPWTMGGEVVTFQWAHVPGQPSSVGGSVTLDTPPYIALTNASAFYLPPPPIPRSDVLAIAWTSDTPASSADQVAVDLQVGSFQLVCIFPASDGMGLIPATAIGLLPAGVGKYNVHSKEAATTKAVGGSGWSFGFNVDAQARAMTGLAEGPVTFE